jgi:hypothetical protein
MDNMMKLLAAALLFGGTAAQADPTADVMATVDAALTAVNSHDGALFQKVSIPQAVIVSQRYDAAGNLKTNIISLADMAASMVKQTATIDERLQNPTVMIRGDLAHVWSPYTIDLDGKRLHCGIDSFGLAKIDGVWKLTSLTWTAEPNGCPK